jgi:hypothetical protein
MVEGSLETIRCSSGTDYIKRASASLLVRGIRDAWIGLRATAVLGKEPRQVRSTILGITAKIVDAGTPEVAE